MARSPQELLEAVIVNVNFSRLEGYNIAEIFPAIHWTKAIHPSPLA